MLIQKDEDYICMFLSDIQKVKSFNKIKRIYVSQDLLSLIIAYYDKYNKNEAIYRHYNNKNVKLYNIPLQINQNYKDKEYTIDINYDYV